MAKFWYGAGFKVISLIIWPQSIVETYSFSSNGVCHAYPYFCQMTVLHIWWYFPVSNFAALNEQQQHDEYLHVIRAPLGIYICISFKAILSKNSKILQINQKLCFMLLESAWKAVYLIQILYLFLQNYSQERPLKILNRNFRSVWTGNPDFSAAKHVTLMDLEFKTLTFKIGALCETNRV